MARDESQRRNGLQMKEWEVGRCRAPEQKSLVGREGWREGRERRQAREERGKHGNMGAGGRNGRKKEGRERGSEGGGRKAGKWP